MPRKRLPSVIVLVTLAGILASGGGTGASAQPLRQALINWNLGRSGGSRRPPARCRSRLTETTTGRTPPSFSQEGSLTKAKACARMRTAPL
jgi:hypothetical protein